MQQRRQQPSQRTKQPPPSLPTTLATIESQITETQSSRIADETLSYEEEIRRKVQTLERESERLLSIKDEEIVMLRRELELCEGRLTRKVEEWERGREEIRGLRQHISFMLKKDQVRQFGSVTLQNNESRHNQQPHVHKLLAHTPQIDLIPPSMVSSLKRQIEQLRQLVAETEKTIRNCPGCSSLLRENQQLLEANTALERQFASREKGERRTELQEITSQVRAGQNLVEKLQERCWTKGLRRGREKLKESVAKRCRTLTDTF